MNTGVAVSDTSPLIALNQIARLDLLQVQFERIIVPPAVVLEVAPSVGGLPAWVHRQHVSVPPEHLAHLHDGEREAIALAAQLGADFLVIDDLPGRRAATRLGLRIIGSLGVLVRAKRGGVIGDVRPMMDLMMVHGLFVSERVYHRILEVAGEQGS